jgi:acetyltransferase-like isoleucine patch superfamily enzyme
MSAYIHEDARVATPHIGTGTRIWQFSIVLAQARIGSDCNINCYVFVENDVVIGDRVTLKSGVQIWDGIRIEDDVFVGPNVTFTNDLLPRSRRKPEAFLNTILRKGCSIGANSTLIGGITVGEYALVGAGSVVTHDVPARELWYGNPAVRRGRVDETGQIIERFA